MYLSGIDKMTNIEKINYYKVILYNLLNLKKEIQELNKKKDEIRQICIESFGLEEKKEYTDSFILSVIKSEICDLYLDLDEERKKHEAK